MTRRGIPPSAHFPAAVPALMRNPAHREICGLPVDCVDFDHKTVTVTQSAWYGRLQTPKSKSAARTIPIPEILCDVLRTYIREWKPNPAQSIFRGVLIHPNFSYLIPFQHICNLWPSTSRDGRRNPNVSNFASLDQKDSGVVIKKHRVRSKCPKPGVVKALPMIRANSCISIIELL